VSNGVLVLVGAGLRGRRRLGVAATFLVLVLAAIGMAAGLVVSRQGAPLLDSAADQANVAHLVLAGDPDAIEEVAADPEVQAWSGPFATIDGLDLLANGEEVPMQLTALETPDIEVNRPPLRDGRWTAGPAEIVLDRSLATDLAIDPGQTVTFRLAGATTEFEVVGTAVNFTDCFYPQCDPGRGWVTTAGLARFDAGDEVYAQGFLRFDDPAQADPFVERQATTGVEGIGGTESWVDTREDFLTLDRVFGSFVTAFGLFVLAVAAVVVAGSTAMRVVARRREIGLLGAVGCTPRQITGSLLLENLAIGGLAAVLGWIVAGFLAPSLQLGIGLTLGPQDPTWSAFGLAVCLAVISALLVVATVVPAVSAARRPVTDVLRDVPRERVSRLSRRVAGLPRRLPWLGAQEVAGQPARGLLAALAMTVAVVGTLVSFGFVNAVDTVAADPATAGDPWQVAILPGDAAPAEVEAVLAATPAVGSWYSDAPRRSTFQEGAFLSIATGGDPEAAGFRVAEGRPMRGAGEGIAGYGFLERFGVSVGDRVTILVGTTPLAIEIVGWYRVTEDSGEVLRYRLETLLAADRDATPSLYRITTTDDADPVIVAASLAERLGPQTGIEVLDTGTDDMAPLLTVLRLVALVLLVMAGTNLLSTLLTSSRESSGRVGVQVAVGFTPGQVVLQGAVAGAVLGVVATVVGVPLGLWLFRSLSDVVSSGLGVGPGWMPAPDVVAVAALAVLAVAVSAALGAAAVRGVARRPPADLLRAE
jgi:putative ABC transport system permease protein